MKILLDTHILLFWLGDGSRLSPQQRAVLDTIAPERPALIATISLWEIATLHELGRITLGLPLREWLEAATAPPLVERVPLTPAIAAGVAALPDTFHRDPADRIIVATAQVLGATLLTLDRRIAASGIVPVVG